MDLTQSLYLYFIVVIVLILILCRSGLRTWSAIVIGLIVGQVLLNFLSPPQNLDSDSEPGSGYGLYIVIQLGTPIIVYIYAFIFAVKDKMISI